MAIDAGDVVLTFLGDTTQLDQAFDRVGSEAATKLGPANQAMTGLGESARGLGADFDATAENVPYLGESIKDAMDEGSEATMRARGELGLLGELFGIHLPRHVRSWLAEMPAVATAMSAAFGATAVFFLIEALAKGIEKLQEWAEHGEKIKQAWEKYDQTMFESSTHMQQEIDKQQQKLIEMTLGPVAALDFALKHLQTTAFETFAVITKDITSAEAAMKEASSSFLGIPLNAFAEGSKDLEKFRSELQDVMRTAAEASPKDPFAPYAAGIKFVQESEDKLKDKIKERGETFATTGGRAVDGLNAELKVMEEQIPILKQGIKLQQDKIDVMHKERAEAEAKKEKQEAEQELKLQADIFKSKEQLAKEIDKQDDEFAKRQQKRLDDEMKHELESGKEQLQMAHQLLEGKQAEIDGEIKLRQGATKQQEDLLKSQFQRGLITAEQYRQRLKQLYDAETSDLIKALNIKEQLVIAEAINEAAQRGKILTVEDARELKAFIDLENKKAQIAQENSNKFLKVDEQITNRMAREYHTVGSLLDNYVKKLREARGELHGFGQVADSVLGDLSNAFGSAIASWINGQESFGKALEKALAQYLVTLAAKAAADALYFFAWGVADSFWNPARAGADFTAAAEFAALAGAAGAAGYGLNKAAGDNKNTGSGGGGPTIDSNSNTTPASNPTQVQNVPHLAAGGLVTGPTLAMVGEHGREAVIPLSDASAFNAIAEAIARHVSGGAGTAFYVQPKGLVSADTMGKLMKKMSRQVQTGRARFIASNSHRITRRG